MINNPLQLGEITSMFKLVVITRPGCPWCNMLKNKTLPTLSHLGIQMYSTAGERVESHYGITAWPAIVYCDNVGNKLFSEEGFVPPTRVIEVLSKLYSGEDPTDESEQQNEPIPNLDSLEMEGEVTLPGVDDPWADEPTGEA